MPDEELDRQIDDQANREHDADQRRDAHELSDQLAGISIEEARNAAGNAVPTSSIVARAVGEQTDREHAPEAVGSVD